MAGGAIDRDDEASQLDLFAPPPISADEYVGAARSTACRSDQNDVPETGEKCAGSAMIAPEGKSVRKKRINTPVHATAIRRLIDAATKAGLAVTTIQASPDGTIVLSTDKRTEPPDRAKDVFLEWVDRL